MMQPRPAYSVPSGGAYREWIFDMNDRTWHFEQSDEDILSFEVSDEALEAAATTRAVAALSMPAAPTVSILVLCCGNDGNAAPKHD
jgi:hypothetical protein